MYNNETLKSDFVVAEFKAVYKTTVNSERLTAINSSRSVANIFRSNWDTDTIEYSETFKVMFLNNANKVLGIQTLATGCMTSVSIDLRTLFAAALSVGATNIILCHNHPTGTLEASMADISITDRIKSACNILMINLLDHIILTANDYYSFTDNGMI